MKIMTYNHNPVDDKEPFMKNSLEDVCRREEEEKTVNSIKDGKH